MRSYLVVANQTLASPTLATAIVERLAEGEASFHVVVPATPIQHGLTWDEAEARAAAQERLEQVLVRLKDLGATARGRSEVPTRFPPPSMPCVTTRSTRSSSRRCRSASRAGSASMSRRVSSEPWQCR